MATALVASAVINEVRKQISDQVTPYRWSDATIRGYMDDAQENIVLKHPEAQYIDSVTHDELEAITSNSQELQISTVYKNAMIRYVVSKIIGEDSEDAANLTLSNDHYIKAPKEAT